MAVWHVTLPASSRETTQILKIKKNEGEKKNDKVELDQQFLKCTPQNTNSI